LAGWAFGGTCSLEEWLSPPNRRSSSSFNRLKLIGFVRTSAAPSFIAETASVRLGCAVNRMTGIRGFHFLRIRNKFKPSSLGIITSESTSCGALILTIDNASSPFSATHTPYPQASRAILITSRNGCSSSTKRMDFGPSAMFALSKPAAVALWQFFHPAIQREECLQNLFHSMKKGTSSNISVELRESAAFF
jgi:hypothetical protein